MIDRPDLQDAFATVELAEIAERMSDVLLGTTPPGQQPAHQWLTAEEFHRLIAAFLTAYNAVHAEHRAPIDRWWARAESQREASRVGLSQAVAAAVDRWNAEHPERAAMFLPLSLRVAIGRDVAAAVPAPFPASWWIAENGDGDPCVWEPRPAAPPRLVVSKTLAGDRLWAVLAGVLPDRGRCARCTAVPCDLHAGRRRTSSTTVSCNRCGGTFTGTTTEAITWGNDHPARCPERPADADR